MNRIQSKNDRLVTYKINKISLSCFEVERHILTNRYNRFGLDY